jgi:heat shock protein HslJ
MVLAACGTSAVDVEGTAWQLVTINGAVPIEGSEITLRFQDGRVMGNSGCNTYGGEYTSRENGAFQVGPIQVTEMGCMDPPGVMDQEIDYLRILQGADTITQSETELTIEGGGNFLVFLAIS